jgi:hypothetical protein
MEVHDVRITSETRAVGPSGEKSCKEEKKEGESCQKERGLICPEIPLGARTPSEEGKRTCPKLGGKEKGRGCKSDIEVQGR